MTYDENKEAAALVERTQEALANNQPELVLYLVKCALVRAHNTGEDNGMARAVRTLRTLLSEDDL